MSQSTPRIENVPNVQPDDLTYEEFDARELALFPDTYKGRRAVMSGKVIGSEPHPSGHLVQMYVPLAGDLKGQAQVVAVQVATGHPPIPSGQWISVKGVCDGIHVVVRLDCCGVTVLPLVQAESVQ